MTQTTTTMIFLLATLLIAAATTVSGQGPTPPIAPSPEGKECEESLTVCAPAVFQKEKISPECCTALDTAAKTTPPCLCGFIQDPELPINVTDFSALISQTCGLTIGPSLCSPTPAPALLPMTKAPAPGPHGSDKGAGSKVELTYLVGIVLVTISAMFY